MPRGRMGRTIFYLLAIAITGVMAMVLTSLADDFLPPSSGDRPRLGLLGFFVIVIFDLFVMYDVWVTRQLEGLEGARMLWKLAVGGLLLALAVGAVLRSIAWRPLGAFLWSFLIEQNIVSFVERWRDRRNPDLTVQQARDLRALAFVDLAFSLFGCFMLIGIWQESRMAVALGVVGALAVVLPIAVINHLQWRARQTGQTTASIPPSVTK